MFFASLLARYQRFLELAQYFGAKPCIRRLAQIAQVFGAKTGCGELVRFVDRAKTVHTTLVYTFSVLAYKG